jgi:hypothetical protein
LDAGLNVQPILNHKSIFGRSGETEFYVRAIQPDEEKFQDPAAETVQNRGGYVQGWGVLADDHAAVERWAR